MSPLVLAAFALGAGWISKKWYDEASQQKQQSDNSNLGLGAKQLDQGKLYTLSLQTNPTAIQTPIMQDFSAAVRAAFEGAGFAVQTHPAPKTESDASKFLAGQQSEWLLQGIWTKPEKAVGALPPWAGFVVAYEAPMTPIKY